MSSGPPPPRAFWAHVWALRGAVTRIILPRVLVFGAAASVVVLARGRLGTFALQVGPVELAGGALVLLLVLRSNAGYERWWEGRKLWGGIVNQSRNLAISGVAYAGKSDPEWAARFARWTAAFSHTARASLRGERQVPDLCDLVGEKPARRIVRSEHMPSAVASELAHMLRDAMEGGALSPVAFLQCDRERALLIDHVGACERILKTPLPLVYVIMSWFSVNVTSG
jgi:ion channel-forming bestrophin family protein